MPVSEMPVLERIARVLAGAAHSSNADGHRDSAAEKVDLAWRAHLNQALAVLHSMREPDHAMAEVGDVGVWSRMIEAAIDAFSFEGEKSQLGASPSPPPPQAA